MFYRLPQLKLYSVDQLISISCGTLEFYRMEIPPLKEIAGIKCIR